jgi:hypothetical protein
MSPLALEVPPYKKGMSDRRFNSMHEVNLMAGAALVALSVLLPGVRPWT